jgi:malate dehydrogenase (quinone)
MAAGWEAQLKQIVPSYGRKLNESPVLTNEIRRQTSETLKLPYLDVPVENATTPAVMLTPPPATAPAQKKRNANEELQAL